MSAGTPNVSAEARALAHYSAMAAEALVDQRDRGLRQGPRHTPGPWAWHGSALRPEQPAPDLSAVHTILQTDGGCGYLGSNVHNTLRELDADMALIAAAPELLNALRMLAWHTQQLLEQRDTGGAAEDRRGYVAISLDIAKAALAKTVTP
jgi:hypothetical protein